jgi:hypothetical protein
MGKKKSSDIEDGDRALQTHRKGCGVKVQFGHCNDQKCGETHRPDGKTCPKQQKTPAKPTKNAGVNAGSPRNLELKSPDWWYQRYFEYGLEHQGTFSIYKLVDWLRGKGLLAQGETSPHIKTLERWSSKEKWVERRSEDLNALADRGEAQLREGLSLRKVGRYRQLEKVVEDLSRHLDLYMNVPEVFDGEQWVERPKPYETEVRPTRVRPRLPSEFGRRSGNLYTQANMERTVSSLEKALASLDRMLPQRIPEPEKDQDDERLVLRVASRDQIAELGAKFGRLVTELRETTERRKIEQGLDDFGEPIKKPDLDAPGRDMLELDEEQGPVGDDDDEWEEIEVDDPGTLPRGMHMNEAGEILPINMPPEDGEWDSGVD